MTYPLVSPGTSVTVTDESQYATAGQGTVPLIIFGTHEYKTIPGGTEIAPGTLPENANKLYPITSQRELLQTFGNPIFYKKNGTPVHGYELNEYGLHAAYQYLGIANRAFVIRADIDYTQLAPRATEPRAEAAHGTNWLDTQNNTWGIYEWTGSQWAERDLFVIETLDDLNQFGSEQVAGQFPPSNTIGVIGDLAMVVYYSKKVLYQKVTNTGWVVVGGNAWIAAKTVNNIAPDLIYNSYLPETSTVGDILVLQTPNVVSSLTSAPTWLLKTFNISTGSWDETLTPIYSIAREDQLNKINGSVYLSHDANLAIFEFHKYNGTAWIALGERAGSAEPTSPPTEGTLWYNPNDLKVTIKINENGSWVPYSDTYENIDPTGVILQGSAPTTQTDGTVLVENDLWVDTSDLENFPKMYRRNQNRWKLIDIANNIDPINGIAFGEAATTSALNFANGMKLYDLALSTNDVKQYVGGQWTNISGLNPDGVPFFGRKAQRHMIVKSLAATISSNEDIRAETVYFNLIATPGYIELIDEMVTLNTDMKEIAFIVGDTPARLAPTGSAIQAFATNASLGNTENGVSTFNPYVGLYYPWGLSTNIDGNEIMVPPSTIALRTIAYNDSVSYQWMAPAGFTRGLVTNASSVGYLDKAGEFKAALLNNGQRDLLYTNKINPIAYIPNRGLVVYGQKTRHNLDTALDRINVARLINYLRYNLDTISKPFLFEPNDYQTRDSVKTVFERFMSNLVGLRGLYDFVVVCDESNNTADRIDRNELWVDIAIQPEKTIEFIYIPLRIVATGNDLAALYKPNV